MLALAPARAGENAPALIPSEEIRLSADRIEYWDAPDGVRWVILQGQAAALLESDGLRADGMAVRIEKVSRRGQIGFEVEVYAEGHARTTGPDSRAIAEQRTTLNTTGQVKLIAFSKEAITALKAPPENLRLMVRGFADRRPVAAAPAAKPEEKREGPPAEVEPLATLGSPEPIDPPVAKPGESVPKRDPAIRKAQGDGDDFGAAPPIVNPPEDNRMDPDQDPVPINAPPVFGDDLNPLPDVGPLVPAPDTRVIPSPILPNTRRNFTVTGGPKFAVEQYGPTENGDITFVLRGGVNVVADLPRKVPLGPAGLTAPTYSTVDLSADSIVIWTKQNPKKRVPVDPVSGVPQDPEAPLQVYMEGNVQIRQDPREVAGKGDEKVMQGNRAYYDLRNERALILDGRVYTSTPGSIAPLRTDGRVINQYRAVDRITPEGKYVLGPKFIRVDGTTSTGSRFPIPGYRFDSQSLEMEDIIVPLVDQTTGGKVGSGATPDEQDKITEIRAFNSVYYLGRIPVFYSPFARFDSEFDPILRNFRFQTGNVFGQQVQFDLSPWRIFNIKKPRYIDNWNFDVDYLSYRGLGLGTELSWFGRDPVGEITDPYGKKRLKRGVDRPYYGYLDMWGLQDMGRDVLGPGPAIITNGPPGAGKAGFQRTSEPPFQQFRGRISARHMQRLLGDDAPDDMDLRYQIEGAYLSDRNFLEEYYKRLFDTGYDQETLFYGIYQKQNRALTLQTEVNLQNWYTETQWLPKLEYTRLGDSFLNNWVNVSMRSGIDYANTHTAVEVANPNIFAFLPRDPVSNTSGTLKTGRAYSAVEVDVPLNIGPEGFEFLKLVPYAQGQLVGWDNQLGNVPLGRAWGAVGARANILAMKTFTGPQYESELLNIHGLAHKIDFQADFRSAYSNQSLSKIGVQDDLDDNTQEYSRRYFALTNYVGGLLPLQYDPRLLTLRRTISPITGTTDIQDTITTIRMGIHQRLQTKRGPEGRRRIIDYMTLDLDTTYFPNARRDNFGKPFGQNTYNYEWFIGDRTSFTSYGWFEFWQVNGQPILLTNPRHTNDPFGLSVITSGFSISRPPRGNLFVGYSIINTGPISTSALNFSYTYWLSPKWYAYVATSYDFGNAILLGTTFSVTKITKDYLTSVGLTVDPQRMNYQFAFEISPRFSPNVRFGSTAGQRFDSRFAATQ